MIRMLDVYKRLRLPFGDKYLPQRTEEDWVLEISEVVALIKKKKNWSAPGPERIANFWWKRATALHQCVTIAFQAITACEESYSSWFCTGKTSLIPKPGEFCSANKRPITCLNTLYKWFTSCTLGPMDQHLDKYGLMGVQQQGDQNWK